MCYELNNRAKHEVYNGHSTEWRVHLIFDWYEENTEEEENKEEEKKEEKKEEEWKDETAMDVDVDDDDVDPVR